MQSESKKGYQIVINEDRKVRVSHFVFADSEEEARNKFDQGETMVQEDKLLAFTSDIIEINEVKCKLVEEENEYTKNYPKKEETQRTLD